MRPGSQWCQPGDDPKRKFIVRFEDTEMGDVVFEDEDEARQFFENADGGGWNCYLFGVLPARVSPLPQSDQRFLQTGERR